MAIYKLFPTKDASIYTQDVEMNTGLDSILEASTYLVNNDPYLSRYLIKFSSSEISNTFSNLVGTSSYQIVLNNFIALAEGLNNTTHLYFYPVSGSWSMGTGRFDNIPSTKNGVSCSNR